MVVIVDLDNCIADDKWRIPLINHQAASDFLKYHSYHMAIPGDPVANRHILEGHMYGRIVISTSRPEMYRWLTVGWLDYHKIRYAQIFMRPKDDTTSSSAEIKRKALHAIRKQFPKCDIVMAYDDRPDVIEMYRQENIPATHLFINPYEWKEWYGERSRDSGSDGFHL